MNNENFLDTMRHSVSHVMAEAVLSMFPDAKFAIGPSIEDGFYYDFDLPRALTPEDLPVIEQKMKEIIKANLPFKHREITKNEAKELFAAQPYKLELIGEIADDKVGVYEQGKFIDLCRGPHVNSTGEIKAFKLMSIAGATTANWAKTWTFSSSRRKSAAGWLFIPPKGGASAPSSRISGARNTLKTVMSCFIRRTSD
jgi:threonyl-tRNA synthetase